MKTSQNSLIDAAAIRRGSPRMVRLSFGAGQHDGLLERLAEKVNDKQRLLVDKSKSDLRFPVQSATTVLVKADLRSSRCRTTCRYRSAEINNPLESVNNLPNFSGSPAAFVAALP